MMLVEFVRVRGTSMPPFRVYQVGALLLSVCALGFFAIPFTTQLYSPYSLSISQISVRSRLIASSQLILQHIIVVVQDTRRAIINHGIIAKKNGWLSINRMADLLFLVSDLGSRIPDLVITITEDHSNQDPQCTQKPLYTPIFTHHNRS